MKIFKKNEIFTNILSKPTDLKKKRLGHFRTFAEKEILTVFERVRSCDLSNIILVCLKGMIHGYSDFVFQRLSRCAIWQGKERTGSQK